MPLTITTWSAWCLTGGYHLPPTTLTGSVRGDIVHVDRIIGVGEIAGAAEVATAACRGCGLCAAGCPHEAVSMKKIRESVLESYYT